MPFEGPHKSLWCNKDNYYTWLRWIANDSLAATAFVTKDPEEMIQEGCIIDASSELDVFMMALILSRVGHELHSRYFGIPLLERCIELGVSPALACGIAFTVRGIISQKTESAPESRWILDFQPSHGYYSHNPILVKNSEIGPLKALIRGKGFPARGNPYNTGKGWSGVWALSGQSEGRMDNGAPLFLGLNKAIEPFKVVTSPGPRDFFGETAPVLKKAGDNDAAIEAASQYLLGIQKQVNFPAKAWRF